MYIDAVQKNIPMRKTKQMDPSSIVQRPAEGNMCGSMMKSIMHMQMQMMQSMYPRNTDIPLTMFPSSSNSMGPKPLEDAPSPMSIVSEKASSPFLHDKFEAETHSLQPDGAEAETQDATEFPTKELPIKSKSESLLLTPGVLPAQAVVAQRKRLEDAMNKRGASKHVRKPAGHDADHDKDEDMTASGLKGQTRPALPKTLKGTVKNLKGSVTINEDKMILRVFPNKESNPRSDCRIGWKKGRHQLCLVHRAGQD